MRSFFSATAVAFLLLFANSFAAAPGSGRCEGPLADVLKKPHSELDLLKVAAVQYAIHGDKTVPEFLLAIEARVAQAQKKGAELIVFPELVVLDLARTTQAEDLRILARDFTPRYFDFISKLARKYQVSILGGSSPRLTTQGNIVNTAYLAFPNAEPVLQDKLFPTPEEKDWGWKGGDELKVFDAPWGRSSILVCYDAEFPLLSQKLVAHRPELLLVPSMTGLKGFYRVRWAAQSRVVEHHAYLLHVGAAPTPATASDFHAQSSLLGPQETHFPVGPIAESSANTDEILYGTFNLSLLRASRQSPGRIDPARESLERKAPIEVIKRP